MAEDDDLDGQIGGVAPLQAQELKRPDEGEIEKDKAIAYRHRSSAPAATSLLKAYG